MHVLDRPVWASLTFAPHLAEGGDLAMRYRRDIHVFAATIDDRRASLDALDDLVGEGDTIYVLQVPPIHLPDGLVATKSVPGVQMLATRQLAQPFNSADIVRLGDDDAADMLALARLTEPGPFLAQTHQMGRFVGIRRGGRLAAMAGERMR